MPTVTFTQSDGSSQEVDCRLGQTLMQAALASDVQGILAECGGACACATCHVIIDESWVGKLPARGGDEEMMLDGAVHVEPGSRLSCQIDVTDQIDGLCVTVPEAQF